MKETKRIPFDLERAKNGARVITREGFDVEIISYNSGDSKYPIVGKIGEGRKDEVHHLWQKDGTSAPFEYNNEDREDYDLFLVVEVEEALQKFNDAYAYVSNMIISLLQEDGKRITSDIRNLGRSVEQAAEYIAYKDTEVLKEDAKKCLCMCTDTDDLIDALETFASRYPCGCSMGYASMEEHICEEATVFLTKKSAEEYLKLNKHNFTKEARVCALSAWRNPVLERLLSIIKTTNWEEI